MLEIANAIVTNVKVGFDDRKRLSVKISLDSQYGAYNCSFILANAVDVQRFTALMNYTLACDIDDLKGRIVRKIDDEGILRGFGHPIEDKFVLFSTKEFTEIFEETLKTMFAK